MAKIEAEISTKKVGIFKKTKVNFDKLNTILIGSIIPILLITVWELLSRVGVFPSYQLPAPTTILTTIYEMGLDGSLWSHIGVTSYRVFAGFLIGTGIAVFLGS